jgi:hypothetical protein
VRPAWSWGPASHPGSSRPHAQHRRCKWLTGAQTAQGRSSEESSGTGLLAPVCGHTHSVHFSCFSHLGAELRSCTHTGDLASCHLPRSAHVTHSWRVKMLRARESAVWPGELPRRGSAPPSRSVPSTAWRIYSHWREKDRVGALLSCWG